ncbi:MAG: filamentous hemagglutinin N-terminal domain-containing protein [Coleofasciculaceae cyanobacterium SM2_1_6]|nr:filamentous hemagglutinin N-terminal domain-containing protein [Coleofasciculaceae cyanobacterium SM2_1_6]
MQKSSVHRLTHTNFPKSLFLLCTSLVLLDQSLIAQAQITSNGAGTVVNIQGNQINITGGTQAGANLFHSFGDFNLNSTQVANFLSNPQTQNILGRINGGTPSFINGLLQVTGGNSNLFLMNPAGIVFGQGASLNVPASFTATTANQIGFGNNLFNAFGDNNFAALVGNPDSFLFTSPQAGSIVNTGNLAVGSGQNLSLIAGNTINTGRLSAPGGEIQVLAVPGTNRVRLSQPGQVLSLEIVLPDDNNFRALDLPTLLTGSNLPGIVVNPSGQVEVAGTSLPNQQGLAVASGRIDVSSSGGNGGTVQIMGDRVAALNSRINANGATGGGTVRLGGEYLGGRDTGIAPALRFNSQRTFVDRNSLIRANATVTGEGGRVIIWADQNTGYFGRITGRGVTGQGGFVEVSGRENLAFDGRVELQGLNGLGGTLLLDPANIVIQAAVGNGDGLLPTILAGDVPDPMTISGGALAAIAAGTAIDIAASGNIDFQANVDLINGIAPITFTAGTITAATVVSLLTRGRSLNIVADSINAPTLTISTAQIGARTGNIQVTANTGDITLNNVGTNNSIVSAGSITLNAPLGTINIASDILASSLINGDGGAVNLTSQGNITIAGNVNTASFNGSGGTINLISQGNTTINGFLNSRGDGMVNNSGAINVTTGNLLRVTNFCAAATSICSNGQGGASNGAVTIRHGGSTTTPFIVGDATTNGTAGKIDAGVGNIINTTTPIPVPPYLYTQGIIQIITTAPPPPVISPAASPISPELFALLRNPAPPATPAPVVVGTAPLEVTPLEPSPAPVVVAPVVVAPIVVTPTIPVVPTPAPTPLPSPTALIPPSTPTPLQINRSGNLDQASPGVQPLVNNAQTCVVRSLDRDNITWIVRAIAGIRGQEFCAREPREQQCCDPRGEVLE